MPLLISAFCLTALSELPQAMLVFCKLNNWEFAAGLRPDILTVSIMACKSLHNILNCSQHTLARRRKTYYSAC